MVDMNNLKVGPIKPMSEEEIKKLHIKLKNLILILQRRLNDK